MKGPGKGKYCNSGIYKIWFPNTKYSYIGSAYNLLYRKSNHYSDLKNSNHCNKFMQNVFNKHGDFIFEVIEYCKCNELREREQYYIDSLKPNLNICLNAERTIGYKHSEETLKKLKEIAKSRAMDETWRKKVSSNWFKKGKRNISEKERLVLRERAKLQFKGKKHTERAKLLMSLAARNRDWSNYKHLDKWNKIGIECSKKPVIQKDLDGNVINYFNSITEAINQFNTKQTRHLILCCKGEKEKYKGFIWEFAERRKIA